MLHIRFVDTWLVDSFDLRCESVTYKICSMEVSFDLRCESVTY